MIRVPPGRAGQVWLRRRLATAQHGIDILSRKQRLLSDERDRRQPEAAVARAAWIEACSEAERWCSRSLRVGHRNQVALVSAQVEAPATMTVDWRNVMAVAIPGKATCEFPDFSRASACTISTSPNRRWPKSLIAFTRPGVWDTSMRMHRSSSRAARPLPPPPDHRPTLHHHQARPEPRRLYHSRRPELEMDYW